MQGKREAALMLLTFNVLIAGCLERELKPLNPCLVSGVTRSVMAKNIDKLDLLFMVDNSGSMKEEQDALRDQFPKLIATLTTGDRSARGLPAFPPVTDLHLGVVSSDMGVPGVANIPTCLPDGGDDGRLQHMPRGAGCAASYPSFLSFNAKGGNPNAIVQDFACISMLGTMGCGFEQQLESPFKALWPSVYLDPANGGVAKNPFSFLSVTAAGTLGRGDLAAVQGGSLGFLRNEPKTGLSLIAIVVVTDEEDCSAKVTDHFKTGTREDINVRCTQNPQNLYDVKNRYWKGFRALRPGNEDLVVFAAIVGVPTDLVDENARAVVKFSEASQRDAYYDRILADSRMQADIVTLPNGELRLRPSCSKPALVPGGDPQTADPPRRIVQLAKEFGENGIVQSICQPTPSRFI
jgi:hypothetical protein